MNMSKFFLDRCPSLIGTPRWTPVTVADQRFDPEENLVRGSPRKWELAGICCARCASRPAPTSKREEHGGLQRIHADGNDKVADH